MKLTLPEVKYIAKLSNLPLTSTEEKKYSQQLSKILEYIAKLGEVDTSEVTSTFNVSVNTNITRLDSPGTCLTQQEVLSNAASEENGFFVTKGVFEE